MSLEDVLRDLRDFSRYAGDGKSPASPYALPHGDPSSSLHVIHKAILRERLVRVEVVKGEVEDLADLVAAHSGNIVSTSQVPYFTTVTTASAASINAMHPVVYVSGWAVSGSGGGYFRRVSSQTGIGNFQDAAGQWWKPTTTIGALTILNGTAKITVNIGTTGHYPDLPTAVPDLLPYASAGGRIELRFVSPITKGYLFRDADFSAFTLTSSIGTVPLASSFVGVADTLANDVPIPRNNKLNNLIAGLDCRMPTLACLIDMGHQGDNGFYPISSVSRAVVLPGCGVINAGFCGMEARTSVVQAMGAVFSGAMLNGIRAAHGAIIAAQAAICDDCVQFPTLAPPDDQDDFVENHKTAAAVDCSRNSVLHFRNGSAKRSGGTGVNGRRAARLVIEGADVSNARYHGIYLSGMATVSAYGVIAKNCGYDASGAPTGGYALWARDAIISVNASILTGSGNTNGIDIRIGDSSPYTSGSTVNASRVLTTANYDATTNDLATGKSYADSVANINVDVFNFPTRYGIVANGAVDSPWDLGIFSPTGTTAGKIIDDTHVMRSSVTSTDARTHIALYNPNGEIARLQTNGSTASLEPVSDEALKANVRPIDIEVLLPWLLDQFVGFDWRRSTDLELTGQSGAGVIAQRLAVWLPQLATPRQGNPGDPGWKPASVDYLGLVPYLGAVLGLHDQKLRALEMSTADMAARLAELGAR